MLPGYLSGVPVTIGLMVTADAARCVSQVHENEMAPRDVLELPT